MDEFNIKDKKVREKLLCETAYYTTTMGYQNRRKYLYIPAGYVTQGGFGKTLKMQNGIGSQAC